MEAQMADSAELFSLKEQLKNKENSLLLIWERKSEFVVSSDIPIQLIDSERKTEAEIQRLKARIAAFGGSGSLSSNPTVEPTPDLVPSESTPAPVPASTGQIPVATPAPAPAIQQTPDAAPTQTPATEQVPAKSDKSVLITVLQILVPTLATIAGAYFAWRGLIDPIRIPIEATRAAETVTVKTTALTQTPTSSLTVSPTNATATSGLPASEAEEPFFDTFAIDGTPDGTKWQVADGDGFCDIHQQEDMLVFSMKASEPIQDRKNCFLYSQRKIPGNGLRSLEARMKVQGDFQGKSALVQLVLASSGFVGSGWIACGLASHQEGAQAVLSIYTNDGNVEEYYATHPVEFDAWYTIRAEIDPTMGVSCFVDDIPIGERVVPKDAENLKSSSFEQFVQATLVAGTSATSYLDYVKMNQ